MADVNVPIKFEIYKGDQLVREEVLAQSPIKIGKLASSDLRLDDETVSRMHGVIEVTGPGDVHVVDLGSTRGTTVNGERVTKARLQSGDEVMFGDCRVIVTFGDALAAQATPAPQVVGRRPPGSGRLRAAAPMAYAPPPQQQYAPPPPAAYAAAAPAVVRAAPSFAGAPGAGAEVEVHDGTRAMEVQTIYRGVVTGTRHLFNPEGKNTHSQGTSMVYAGLGVAVVAIGMFVATAMDVGAEKVEYEQWQAAGKESKSFLWKDALPGQRRHRVRRPRSPAASCRTWASSAAARPARTSSSAPTETSTRRCRRSTCRRRRTRWSPRPALTTSSTSRRA